MTKPKPPRPGADQKPGAREERPYIEVAAGVIFRERKLLITQRFAGAHQGGLWEFPGGKRHAEESFEQCLHRELVEELGIEVEIGPIIDCFTHVYPEKTVFLKFFQCAWKCHEPRALGCPAFRWITAEELGHYSFPPADARLLARLPNYWP